MGAATPLRALDRNARWRLIAGLVTLALAVAGRSWLLGLLALALLLGPLLALRSTARTAGTEDSWHTEHRSLAEGMARPLDPTPKRLIPLDESAGMIAQVATTEEALSRLVSDRPPAWRWALFASVLVQRRNAVQDRLRRCVSGYQPRPGLAPLSGRAYSQTAVAAMNDVADVVAQIEQFMLSPAFTGAFGDPGDENTADPDAIISVANRLMDYHNSCLKQAEACLQTPVQREAMTLVKDMGAFTLIPLLAYERFITTMCARVAEAQELLPYTRSGKAIALDDVTLGMELPAGLTDHIVAQIKRFNRSP